ncbi:hypothetical protein E4U26_006038 [Claviceps purpurea]|nr:hypothetical protein E4U26_006038 [Claviceps purpurea]
MMLRDMAVMSQNPPPRMEVRNSPESSDGGSPRGSSLFSTDDLAELWETGVVADTTLYNAQPGIHQCYVAAWPLDIRQPSPSTPGSSLSPDTTGSLSIMRLSLAFVLALIAVVAASGSESASCGAAQYSSDAIARAANASCSRVKKGTAIGANSYPHVYRNSEKIDLKGLRGPFYEWPILSNGRIYDGGNPGPDRVIITKDCTPAGVLSHQGAMNNAFRECALKTTSDSPALMAQSRLVLAVYLAMMVLVFAE